MSILARVIAGQKQGLELSLATIAPSVLKQACSSAGSCFPKEAAYCSCLYSYYINDL